MKSARRIRLAARQCLSKCSAGDMPLACLAEFAAELRRNGWSEPDVRGVETIVLRLLAAVLDDAEHQMA